MKLAFIALTAISLGFGLSLAQGDVFTTTRLEDFPADCYREEETDREPRDIDAEVDAARALTAPTAAAPIAPTAAAPIAPTGKTAPAGKTDKADDGFS
jgi:hypothetical protein